MGRRKDWLRRLGGRDGAYSRREEGKAGSGGKRIDAQHRRESNTGERPWNC